MKRKLICMCFSMAVFGVLLSGCGEEKNKKDTADSGTDVDVESYDFSQDESLILQQVGFRQQRIPLRWQCRKWQMK